ncbi:winged helix-turn-helix transcriptional regulator [Bacillus altitudinis]|uniref:winged helix-turn-helix transcriptional regulator n=1 Tax=Bacillus altitudinis TaxID=293387 RepID=UPI001F1DDA5C|nr:winged helix-turn-helix transcriptional regulator [Bacillus altitudinis]
MHILHNKCLILIINHLFTPPKPFSHLQNQINITPPLLSQTLKHLQPQPLVHKKLYPHIPLPIQYQLTQQPNKIQPLIPQIYPSSLHPKNTQKPQHLPS